MRLPRIEALMVLSINMPLFDNGPVALIDGIDNWINYFSASDFRLSLKRS